MGGGPHSTKLVSFFSAACHPPCHLCPYSVSGLTCYRFNPYLARALPFSPISAHTCRQQLSFSPFLPFSFSLSLTRIFLWCNNNCLITILSSLQPQPQQPTRFKKQPRFRANYKTSSCLILSSGISEREREREGLEQRRGRSSICFSSIFFLALDLVSLYLVISVLDLCGLAMRIRKRKVPLPFHLVSPVPIPPSFFSSDPGPTATTATPPPPLVQLRQDHSGTGGPIPASDDNKAGAAGFGSNPTYRPNRAERNSHVGSDGIGWAHLIYPISWEDGKDEFGIKRSISANNVAAAAAVASKGSKCSSSTDPEILGQQQRQSAAPASASASTSHQPPVLGAMSTWCKEYPHHKDTKNDNSNNKLIPSRKRSSWSSSPSSSSSSSSYFDINGDPATIRSPSKCQQEVRPQAYQTHPRDTKVVHADHISGIGGGDGGGGANSNDKKKRTPAGGGRTGGGVVMEGSRCSRVNGRGWRCSQPTLVGYSLCEHHLGKGRLRSITTASNLRPPPRQLGTTAATPSSVPPKTKPNPSLTMITSPVVHPFYGGTDTRTKHIGVVLPSSSNYGLYDEKEEEEEEGKTQQPQFVFPSNKKKSKLGTVKARSISSLLDQPDNSNAALAALLADNHHHN
ncbi:unnamed protein product [Linum tenue]|uniref:WRC domain-containing protein n=1 Tax=Linum tenue TaxID=586396 RepID=A0AAV0J0H6_9ROSI|nr:unnamed protein product [Linum tenue]